MCEDLETKHEMWVVKVDWILFVEEITIADLYIGI